MKSFWYPDSCFCVIEQTKRIFVKKCRLHQNSRDVTDVYTHNASFNRLTTRTAKESTDEKIIERDRIRNL